MWNPLAAYRERRSRRLSALLDEMASVWKHLDRDFTSSLASAEVSKQLMSCAVAVLKKGERNRAMLERLSSRRRRNELYVEWGTPDELIHLAGIILTEMDRIRTWVRLREDVRVIGV